MAQKRDAREVRKIVKKYLGELKRRNIDIEGAYLFGSYAKGNATAWSDIDVALLARRFIGDSFDFRFLLMKIAREIDLDIEPHPYLADEFKAENPVAAEVMATGVKVL